MNLAWLCRRTCRKLVASSCHRVCDASFCSTFHSMIVLTGVSDGSFRRDPHLAIRHCSRACELWTNHYLDKTVGVDLCGAGVTARPMCPCAVCWHLLLFFRVAWADWLSAGEVAGSGGTEPASSFVPVLCFRRRLLRCLPWVWIAFSSLLSTLDTVEYRYFWWNR